MDALTTVLFLAGLVLLVGGAELFVRGASRAAGALGLSPLVIGLTVVALGTTAPEIAVCVQAAVAGKGDIALGNVVGSNILNVLLILGLSAVVTPLSVQRQLVRLDVPIMIGASLLTIVLALDRQLGRLDGALLAALAVAYTAFLVLKSRREEAPPATCEYEATYGKHRAPPPGAGTWAVSGLLVVGGVGMLVLGSRWLVAGAVAAARALGMSEMVVGLTVVAVGTSLPELATSVVASLRGMRDIAVGNVVGSNIYNIMVVLGLTALISPTGVTVSRAALAFDLPVMAAVAMACLPVFFTGTRISRLEGAFFLTYYAAYTTYLVLASAHHDALGPFSLAVGIFVLPISLVALVVSLVRAFRR